MQEQILHALGRNAIDEAVALSRQWVEQAPGLPRAVTLLATALRRAGKADEALAVIDQALQRTPGEAELHMQRATLLLGMRQIEQASAALKTTTELDPNSVDSYVLQGNLALLRGELDEAERQSRLAALLEADNPQLALIDGMVALHRGDADRALSLLSTAAGALPDDPRLSYGLGFAFMGKGHLAFAEQAFRRVLDSQPGALPIIGLVAELCLRQDNAAAALEMVDRMLAAPGGDALPVRVLAAEMLLHAGQPQRAAEQALLVQQQAAGERRSLQVLLMAWERLNAVEQARSSLDALLETSPGEHSLWLARLAVEVVGSEEAAAVGQRWVDAMPDHVPALETRMRLHDMRGEGEQAEAVAGRIIALAPQRFSGHQRLVTGLVERDPAQAVAHVQGLLDNAPDNARGELQGWLALVHDRAGQHQQAVANWLEVRRAEAGQRLSLPPQAKSPTSWPEMGQISGDNAARPLFVWGGPGSGVERVVAVMAAASSVVRSDRFSPQPPTDAFQRYDTLQALATDQLTPQALVDGWRQGLAARGIADGNVIDWLLWWDNALLWALRPQLPEGRLLVVLRDPRDMLLEWLAFGGSLPLAIKAIGEAADWLVRSLEQIARLHEQALYPCILLRIDGAENNPEELARRVGTAFGLETFPVLRQLPPPRLPAGHWRQYRDVLGAAFNNLTPVAVRLGYLEN